MIVLGLGLMNSFRVRVNDSVWVRVNDSVRF